MRYPVGQLLNIDGLDCRVIGVICYKNVDDKDKKWSEYRLKTEKGERWLSCDDYYREYSISWPAKGVDGRIGPEWHKVDQGTQKVVWCEGDVDVDPEEQASFIEYEDDTQERTLSVEIWSDGTEYSYGEYIDKKDIVTTGYRKPCHFDIADILMKAWFAFLAFALVFSFWTKSTSKSMRHYVKESDAYTYETSITGNEAQKADVYVYYKTATTDEVAKDIINGIEGNTESVTQKDNTSDEEIAILTSKEYCLVYHPESDEDMVYVQVSKRKYNYTSDNAPYRISSSDATWYRSHYYSSGYSTDSSTYSRTPSAYSMYDGDTIHDIGNGYYDTYSYSIRQASINSRSSSSGGISSGK